MASNLNGRVDESDSSSDEDDTFTFARKKRKLPDEDPETEDIEVVKEPTYREARSKIQKLVDEKRRQEMKVTDAQQIEVSSQYPNPALEAYHRPEEVVSDDEDVDVKQDPDLQRRLMMLREHSLAAKIHVDLSLPPEEGIAVEESEPDDEEDDDDVKEVNNEAKQSRQSERQKLTIVLQSSDKKIHTRVFADDPFSKILSALENMYKRKVRLEFDGDVLEPSETPLNLEMEDDEIIDFHLL
ncbi:hypothetical protein AAMO2058_001312100 [Amorphochlora amoebiformis]